MVLIFVFEEIAIQQEILQEINNIVNITSSVKHKGSLRKSHYLCFQENRLRRDVLSHCALEESWEWISQGGKSRRGILRRERGNQSQSRKGYNRIPE